MIKEIKNLENKLKIIDMKEIQGVKIRSWSQWIEDGEKPSRFFFSLEKKHANDNFIPSLLNENEQEISSLFHCYWFYKNLFSASSTDNDIQQELINNLEKSLNG